MKALGAGDRKTVRQGIYKYLSEQPDVESSKRKRLRQNPIAEWELRLQDYWRVLYNIYADLVEVEIIAIGRKRREKLLIDGKEVKL